MALFYLPITSAFGQNVRPSDGAKLYFYEAGTTTPVTIYSDFGEITPLSNPVIANASGRFPAIYCSVNIKVVLKDKNDVQIWEEDDLRPGGGIAALTWKGDFDSSTNAGDYPDSGDQGDFYRVTEKFVLNAASGSHQLYVYDFIIANKNNASDVDADWNIIKGKDWLIDEDDFASNDVTLAPSQQSTKAYVDNQIQYYAPIAALWDASITYAIGAYVKASDNKIYKAKLSQSGNDPSGGGDTTNWEPFGDLLNVLTSTDTTRGLTAAQGKVLKDLIDAESANKATISNYGNGLIRIPVLTELGSADPLHDIQFNAGNFPFEDGTGEAYTATITKQLDASWAAGNNAGGRAAGVALANNTWYFTFVLSNAAGTVVDAGFDTDKDAANLLADANVVAAGLTKYLRRGSCFTDGSSNITPYLQIDKKFYWQQYAAATNYNPGSTAVTVPVIVPPNIAVIALINAFAYVSGGTFSATRYFRIFSDALTSITPTPSLTDFDIICAQDTTAGWQYNNNISEGYLTDNGNLKVVAIASTDGSNINFITRGWEDLTLG